MNQPYRISFLIVIIFSVLNTVFMMNIHEKGLQAMNQFYIHGPVILIGAILLLYLLVYGFIQMIKKNTDENWKAPEKIMFLLSPVILIYNVCIIWFLAR